MGFLLLQIRSWKERREEAGKDQGRRIGSAAGAGSAPEEPGLQPHHTVPPDAEQATPRPPATAPVTPHAAPRGETRELPPGFGKPWPLAAAPRRILFSHFPLGSRRKHAARVQLLRDAPKRQRACHRLTRAHGARVGWQAAAGQGHPHPAPTAPQGRRWGAGTRGACGGWPPALCLRRRPWKPLGSNAQVWCSRIPAGSFPAPQHGDRRQDPTTSSRLPVPGVFHCSRHQRHRQGRAAGMPWGRM